MHGAVPAQTTMWLFRLTVRSNLWQRGIKEKQREREKLKKNESERLHRKVKLFFSLFSHARRLKKKTSNCSSRRQLV